MKVIHETLRVQSNVISTFVLISFDDKHQLTNLHDRQDDNMLVNRKCRNKTWTYYMTKTYISDTTLLAEGSIQCIVQQSSGAIGMRNNL
jgi:hypothetical protein